MTSSAQQEIGNIAEVVGNMRRKGVRLWAHDSELRYKAPKGVLTPQEVRQLRGAAVQIVEFLQQAGRESGDAPLQRRARIDQAPLTFSQLAHWHLYRLYERPTVRQIASATRLRGALDLGALRSSVVQLMQRHEALRTQIVVVDGAAVQQISAAADCELPLHDLSGHEESARESALTSVIDRLILGPVRLDVDPLFAVALVKLRHDEHVLVVAMEHMISDAFSMNILLRDLFASYARALEGGAPTLPDIPIQLADYADWQRRTHPGRLAQHGDYWTQRLRGAQRLRFPRHGNVASLGRAGWGTVPLLIDAHTKNELCAWCRLRRTTLVMAVFSVYVGLTLRWYNVSEAVLRYQIDGRVTPKVQDTIGYFACILHLRIELSAEDTFVQLLERITAEYCSAQEHCDFSYLDSQAPRAGFAHNGGFNWVPQGNSHARAASESTGGLAQSPVPFVNPVLKFQQKDSEPVVLLYDIDEQIVGGVYFPLSCFASETMERFARNFHHVLLALLRRPEERVSAVPLL